MKYIVKSEKVYMHLKDGSEQFLFDDVKIKKLRKNINTNIIQAIIEFKFAGEKIEISAPRSTYLTKKNLLTLQDKGLGVTEENAKFMVDYLIQQESMIKVEVSHIKLGYDSDNETFRLYNSVTNGSIYEGDLDIEPKGTYKGWLNGYMKEVKGKKELEFALVIGASSALVGMVGKEIGIENPIVHIYGDSSTGKTTAVQLALSIWGNTNTKANGLMQNYNETINSLMHNLRNNNGVAMCFDEISMSGSEDFTSFIYSTTNGKEKGRLSNEAGRGYIKLEQATWNTVILSTGEYSILEKAKENDGLKVRVFSIGGIQWTKSARNSDAIKKNVLANYGHAGEKFASSLLEIGKDKLLEKYENLYDKLSDKFKKEQIFDELTNRRVKYYTLLLITSDLLNKYLQLGIDVKAILDILMSIEKTSIVERNIGEQAYKKFLELVSKSRRKFPIVPSKRDRGGVIKDDIWGYVLKKDTQIEVFPHEFRKQCMQMGFQSHNVILNRWKLMGKLDHEADRNDRQRKVGQVYVINVDKEFIKNIEGQNIDI